MIDWINFNEDELDYAHTTLIRPLATQMAYDSEREGKACFVKVTQAHDLAYIYMRRLSRV